MREIVEMAFEQSGELGWLIHRSRYVDEIFIEVDCLQGRLNVVRKKLLLRLCITFATATTVLTPPAAEEEARILPSSEVDYWDTSVAILRTPIVSSLTV